ncbi:hypothetical protein ACE6H2_012960 [Prunus campanulata]
MNNDLPSTNPEEEAMSYFDLSKNDSYLISPTRGMISIFEYLQRFMPPPPAATYLAFHPQDDSIVAIGMDNSTIVIYNLHSYEVTRKLEGHAKRVTSLAFLNALNVLGWEKHRSKLLQILDGKELRSLSDTYIKIHQNELPLLAINKTHLAVYGVKELACV